MSACECDLRTRLVGDGCAQCNPQMTIDLLKEQVQEQADEIARLRITDAEREVVEWAIEVSDSLADCGATGTGGEESRESAVLRGLLERLGGER